MDKYSNRSGPPAVSCVHWSVILKALSDLYLLQKSLSLTFKDPYHFSMILKGYWSQHNADTHSSTWSGISYLIARKKGQKSEELGLSSLLSMTPWIYFFTILKTHWLLPHEDSEDSCPMPGTMLTQHFQIPLPQTPSGECIASKLWNITINYSRLHLTIGEHNITYLFTYYLWLHSYYNNTVEWL